MSKLKWVSNIYDTRKPGWESRLFREYGESREQAAQDMRAWLADKVIGQPQVPPGSPRTVAELKKWGMVGVYVWAEDDI